MERSSELWVICASVCWWEVGEERRGEERLGKEALYADLSVSILSYRKSFCLLKWLDFALVISFLDVP
jgi:hypothetical protein